MTFEAFVLVCALGFEPSAEVCLGGKFEATFDNIFVCMAAASNKSIEYSAIFLRNNTAIGEIMVDCEAVEEGEES